MVVLNNYSKTEPYDLVALTIEIAMYPPHFSRALQCIRTMQVRSGSRPGLRVSKTQSNNFRSRPLFLKYI